MNIVLKYTLIVVGVQAASALAGVLSAEAFRHYLPDLVSLFIPVVVAAITGLTSIGSLLVQSPLRQKAVEAIDGDPPAPGPTTPAVPVPTQSDPNVPVK